MSTCPVRSVPPVDIGHCAATMNSVRPSGPPNAHEKHPRSTSTVLRTVPPSATRTHRLPGTSAYHTAFSASVQMPSGVPVATVGLSNATNAAILAVQMLALSREGLRQQLRNFKKELSQGLKI